MAQARISYTLLSLTACAAAVLICLGPVAQGFQSHPLPRAKPPIPKRAKHVYPLPRPNPRRRPGIMERTEQRPVRPTPKATPERRRRPGSRASEDRRGNGRDASWSADEIAQARRACRLLLQKVDLAYTEADPIGGPGTCGVAAPVKVSSIGGRHRVAIDPPAILNCSLAAAAVKWMDTKVQISALSEFGTPVTAIRNVSSYVCRRRNNQAGGKLSEHALGNALDVAAFTLGSGEAISVLDGWRGKSSASLIEDVVSAVLDRETPSSRFLQQVHKGACEVFSTILGPDANRFHADHFHLDLGRGGRYLVCR